MKRIYRNIYIVDCVTGGVSFFCFLGGFGSASASALGSGSAAQSCHQCASCAAESAHSPLQ